MAHLFLHAARSVARPVGQAVGTTARRAQSLISSSQLPTTVARRSDSMPMHTRDANAIDVSFRAGITRQTRGVHTSATQPISPNQAAINAANENIERSNCGMGLFARTGGITVAEYVPMHKENGAKGAVGVEFPDGNVFILGQPTEFLCEEFPEYKAEIEAGDYQLATAYVEKGDGATYLNDAFASVGLNFVASAEHPYDASHLLPGERVEPRQLTRFLIIKPEVVSGLDETTQKLTGISNGDPMTDLTLFRLKMLAFARVLLHPERKQHVDLMNISRDVSVPNLEREEVADKVFGLGDIRARFIAGHTRASTTTAATMIGNHSWRIANEQNTSYQQLTGDFFRPDYKDLLGFEPDFTNITDSIIVWLHYGTQVLFGRDPEEAAYSIFPMRSLSGERPTTARIFDLYPYKHSGPTMSIQFLPIGEDNKEVPVVVKDPFGKRPGSGWEMTNAAGEVTGTFMASSRPSKPNANSETDTVTPMEIPPGTPLILAGAELVPYSIPGHFIDKATAVLNKVPMLDSAIELTSTFTPDTWQSVFNANGFGHDRADFLKNARDLGKEASVSMGTPNPFTGPTPLYWQVETARGTAPMCDRNQLSPPEGNHVMFGKLPHPFEASLLDPAEYNDVVRLDAVFTTPAQHRHITEHGTVIVADMSPNVTGDEMMIRVKAVAEKIAAAIARGEVVEIRDCDPSAMDTSIPIEPLLIAGALRNLSPDVHLRPVSYTSYKTMYPQDLYPLFVGGIGAIYVPGMYDPCCVDSVQEADNLRTTFTTIFRSYAGGAGVPALATVRGDMSKIGLSKPSAEILDLFGLPSWQAYDFGEFSPPRIAMNSRDTHARISRTGEPLGETHFLPGVPAFKPTRDARHTDLLNKQEFADIERLFTSGMGRLISIRPDLNGGRLVDGPQVVIAGSGPAGLAAVVHFYRRSTENGTPTPHITMFERGMPGGLARTANRHPARIGGPFLNAMGAFEFFRDRNSLTIVGGVSVSDNDLRAMQAHALVIDARGVTENSMPTSETLRNPDLATTPASIYNYSGGDFTQQTDPGFYRSIPPGFTRFPVFISGMGNVCTDMADHLLCATADLSNPWLLGSDERPRPPYVVAAYRNGPDKAPASIFDLKALEDKGIKIEVFGDFSSYPSVSDLEGVSTYTMQDGSVLEGDSLERLTFYLTRYAGVSLRDIPKEIPIGKYVAVVFNATITGLDGHKENPSIQVTLEEKRDGETRVTTTDARGAIFAHGYAKSSPPVGVPAGQKIAPGNINHVQAMTESALSAISDAAIPVGPRPDLDMRQVKWGVEELMTFFRGGYLSQVSNERDLRRAMAGGEASDAKPKVDSKKAASDLIAYVKQHDLQPKPKDTVTRVHIVSLGRTFELTPEQITANGGNVLSALYKVHLEKEGLKTKLEESCGFQGSCLTCFGVRTDLLDTKEKGANSFSKFPDFSTVMCAEDATAAAGKVYIILGAEEVVPVGEG